MKYVKNTRDHCHMGRVTSTAKLEVLLSVFSFILEGHPTVLGMSL